MASIGFDKIDSYVIDLGQDLRLGMEKTADSQGIYKFDDINIIDDAQHPLIALTETIKTKRD